MVWYRIMCDDCSGLPHICISRRWYLIWALKTEKSQSYEDREKGEGNSSGKVPSMEEVHMCEEHKETQWSWGIASKGEIGTR